MFRDELAEKQTTKNLGCYSSSCTNASKSCGNFFFPKDREAGSFLLGPSDDDDDLPPRSRELKHLQHPANQNTAERRQSRSILDSFFSPLSISGRSGGAGNTQEGLIKGPFHHPLHPAPSLPLASLTRWRRSAFQRC